MGGVGQAGPVKTDSRAARAVDQGEGKIHTQLRLTAKAAGAMRGRQAPAVKVEWAAVVAPVAPVRLFESQGLWMMCRQDSVRQVLHQCPCQAD